MQAPRLLNAPPRVARARSYICAAVADCRYPAAALPGEVSRAVGSSHKTPDCGSRTPHESFCATHGAIAAPRGSSSDVGVSEIMQKHVGGPL